MRFALGNMTLHIEVVYPMLTYDSGLASLVNRPPQMEDGGRVQNLLSDHFPLLEIEDPGTDLLDLQEILLEQLVPCFLEGCLRGSGQGANLGLLNLWLLPHFGGCDTILGTTCHDLMAMLQEFKGKSDLGGSTRWFLL